MTMFVLLIGAPGSGKSTISKELSEVLPFKCVDMEPFVRAEKRNPFDYNELLSETQIEGALIKQLDEVNRLLLKDKNVIALFTYHRLSYAIRLFNVKLDKKPQIFLLHASRKDLLERNSSRDEVERVPQNYVNRCYEDQKTYLNKSSSVVHVLNTSQLNQRQCVNQIIKIINPSS